MDMCHGQLLPEHLANILLDSLLQQKRVNHVQLGTFAPCATSIRLADQHHVGDGGTALEVGPLLSLTRLASLRLVDMKVGDRDCAGIAALTQLTELDLRATSVSDTGVQGLSRLLRLHRLDVTWTQATAPPALSSLTNLHMENCWVGGEVALRVLHSTRFPNLRELHMSMTQFDDAGIELLRAFCIDSAPDSSANNDVVKCLTDLTNLRMLSLKSTEIDDAALPLLQSLKGSLTSLDISGNNITGEQAPEQSWGRSRLHHLRHK
ncbi:RNI-like protein [Coccomyxa subellipsoidea C-169]|uniref:RNI-like protein n=1 Tax=Coccomyxa subellipsoidea (strain C-169) TaxID=574566 RepID=I0YVA3_COCSC|nr:RNI-like protein [Coccomyxa subellipsoidea C-169]EIE22322.1 RNI-like protein [Coccomyxa subellipsoidea C-169]|eukprot:XP_005646866.1 RNI-like protein [Coccomyxa subellipsoidea C-169]